MIDPGETDGRSSAPVSSGRTAVVILAAGAGTRFEGPVHKLRALLDGVPLVRRCVDVACGSGVGPVFVVTGSEPLADLLPPGVTEVRASDWSSGQSRSLAAAVRSLETTTVEAMVVGLADMPWVTPSGWRAVAGTDSPIAVATYGGHRRLPVRIARSLWAELPTAGDEGARGLVRAHPELVRDVAVQGSGRDVDTVVDLG
jgi:CTP:molybdopterin cytidylyltransferase MocA